VIQLLQKFKERSFRECIRDVVSTLFPAYLQEKMQKISQADCCM